MRNILFIFLSCLALGFIEKTTPAELNYQSNTYSCLYHRNQGRLDGQYNSYYRNGRKRAEGYFDNNQRTGKWSVWDSTGILLVQRIYTDPYNYKQLVPKVPNNKLVGLLNVPMHKAGYNQNGYINYFDMQYGMAENVIYLYKWLAPEQNPLIFDHGILFKTLCESVRNKSLSAYPTPYDPGILQEPLLSFDNDSIRLIGYKLRHEWIFDNVRLVSEFRPLEFCPVVVRDSGQDTIDLFWIRYWDCRKIFAGITLSDSCCEGKINTMDDLFFYHYFHGSIYMERGYKNIKGSLEDDINVIPVNERDKKTEQEEINLIEHEHDLWVTFTGGKSYWEP